MAVTLQSIEGVAERIASARRRLMNLQFSLQMSGDLASSKAIGDVIEMDLNTATEKVEYMRSVA